MKKTWISILLIIAVLCVYPTSAMAEAPDGALIPETNLTEAQESWIWQLRQYAPYWERFQTVELPDQSWFRVYALPGNVYALFENRQSELVISYLILGEKSALLWDTGLGIGDLRACAEALTKLPITVLNSHNHPDHIGGNARFDRVMCYDIDSAVERLTRGYSHEELEGFIVPEEIIEPPSGFPGDSFCIAGKAPTATVKDGQKIDLGNRELEVIYTPGHNSSCITLIDERNGLLFTGDTWYPGPLYAFNDDSSMADYLESMRKIENVIREKNIRWVYCSHNAILPDTEPVFETTDFLEDVIKGKLAYTVEDGLRFYELNELISIYVSEEALSDFDNQEFRQEPQAA